MTIFDTDCMEGFVRMCADGWKLGWHERNGGNLSYRMTEDDILQCHQDFTLTGRNDHEWHSVGVASESLAGEYFIVTGAGRFMRNALSDPASVCGIVQLDETGGRYRIVWGLEDGGRPTSEFATHILNHAAALERSSGRNRVVYHAHCPNIIAASTLLPADARTWSRMLWKCMTEYVLFFPKGIGVVPWMVAGGADIAEATALAVQETDAVVWSQHGLFVTGNSFDEAFGLAEMAEKATALYLKARAANGGKEPPFTVSDAQLRQVCEAFGVEPREDYLD